MKIVTVCEQGLNRAVTAKWLLQFRNHEVIAAGLKRLSSDTLQMLFDWADLIVLLDGRYVDDIPPEKLLVWDVGPDRFEHHYNPELVAMLRQFGKDTDPSVWKGGPVDGQHERR